MNFLEPQPTPYDLRWRMLGISVRVHPTFWIFSAIFGWSFFQAFGFLYLLIWIGCSFLSILVHELGHVVMGRLCGQPGHIILYAMGGLAVGQYQLARRWQRIAISLAGPAAGFLLLGLVIAAYYVFENHLLDHLDPTGGNRFLRAQPGLATIFGMLVFMNLFWNLINLIPVFPLDGGQVLREVMTGIMPEQGLRFAFGLSFLFAGIIAAYSFMASNRPDLWYLPGVDRTFPAIFFALLAAQSFMLMQDAERQQRRRWEEDW